MRRLLPLLALLALAPSLHAADDVNYARLLADSKLHYKLLGEPSKTPVPEMNCPRRFATTRVVPDGTGRKLVDWNVKPEASALIDEAETLFQAKQYDAAREKYEQAIAKDADAVVAYFAAGDTLLFSGKDPAGALQWYLKGIALDPTLPLGYFFSSTAYIRLGRTDDAREAVIKALTLHPAYESIWTVAKQTPEVWGIQPVVRHPFTPPAGYLGVKGKDGIDVYGGPDAAWLGYAICKAAWANEKQFASRRSAGGWSLDEERACVLSQLDGAYNVTESRLENVEKERGVENPVIERKAVMDALPPLERHIFEAAEADLLDGYILFEIIGQRCPIAISILPPEPLQQIEAYIRKYVILPAK
jgi:tetratricopeptide (TPR) repeat protein